MKFPRPLALLFLAGATLRADVSLAPLFVDHAVLQRNKPVPVWGRADAGEKIAVSFAGQKVSTTAGSDGRWIVFLEKLETNAIGGELVAAGKNTVTVRDVVVGEVWLCSGQSNMEWVVSRAANATEEIAAANYPLIRHLKVRNTVGTVPADTVPTSGWLAATPANVGNFTAVGYFFARDIHQKLGVPVGLINSSWGGTPVESWLSPAAVAGDPAFKVVPERWAQNLADYPANKAAFDATLAVWTKADEAAKATGKEKYAAWQKQNPRPRAPRGVGSSWTPTSLYLGMINPLAPYALRGVLWYQGESNADRAWEYRALFSAMITAWRGHFAQRDLPFYWVNLANYDDGNATARNYAFLREAQTQTLALPDTGQAVTIDIGNPIDVHPTNKQDVGRRLALLAKNRLYQITCDDTGPTFASATREGRGLRVRFMHASGGLISHDKAPDALELAGADKVFHPATGKIEGETLLVSSPAVREPVAVRYAMTNAPHANLFNGAGLPAVPFRSDDW